MPWSFNPFSGRLDWTEAPVQGAGVYTPEAYGSVGNKIADDSDAVQAAVDAWLAAGILISTNCYLLGELRLTKQYRVTRPIVAEASSATRNYFGGIITGNGLLLCDTGGVGLSFRTTAAGWQGLTVKELMFLDCPVEAYAMSDAAALYGAVFQRLNFRTQTAFTLPAFRGGSMFESTLRNCEAVWSSTTQPAILLENQTGSSTTASSITIDSCNTRGGKQGLYVKGYWTNQVLTGGAYLQANEEGVRLETNRCAVFGTHVENNCQVAGDSGIRIIGNGTATSLSASQNGGSLQKYAVRVYAASPVVLIGGQNSSVISGAKVAALDGDGGANSVIKLVGVQSYDTFGGAVGKVATL